jgi:hypothetical protein
LLYVIGGNAEQASHYIHANRLNDACVVDEPAQLAKLQAPDVVLVGTYICRRDVQAFEIVFDLTAANVSFG